MQDQVFQLPSCVPGALLHSGLSEQESERVGFSALWFTLTHNQVLEKIEKGEVALLIVSPEKLTSTRFLEQAKRMPPIWLACIDEAHCISEWSHNFRCSYLRLRKVLYQVTCTYGNFCQPLKPHQGLASQVCSSPNGNCNKAHASFCSGISAYSTIQCNAFLLTQTLLAVRSL